jgi:hypothetical protein
MTSMPHALPGATHFDRRRQLGELESVASSVAGSTYYTGWPSRMLVPYVPPVGARGGWAMIGA